MGLRVLIVDDETLARSRLRALLAECRTPGAVAAGEAANAAQAMELLTRQPFDAVLLDIHMPGADGLGLARALVSLPQAPAVVFVTAYAEHAVAAFELEAIDYLTKPVRLERLQAALQKIERVLQARAATPGPAADSLLIHDRGRTERVPLAEVLYFKAELKYVTVRTANRSYILDASLTELEERHAIDFLRVHRNALVARRALRALERHDDAEEGEGWAVRLNGIDEVLAVSRRQLGAVREALAG
ncbi:MAG TPA: LytTR family DNA-binding domain-containing protein [Ramlibacter sp.]|nr:LytTR family DNA-binding domain-containing protein [Ramlibacter sp.]